jgi:putative membrane protein
LCLTKTNFNIMKWSTASGARINSIQKRPLIAVFAGIFAAFWAISFAGTTDLVNWWIENLLVILFTTAIVLTFRRFAFSDLSYAFMLLFLVLHVYGAKYAYADNPFGFWIKREFNTVHNPYDRIVHTSFGLLMAYPMRELLMRKMKTGGRWSWILPVELVLSLSALFELIEWSIADVFFPAHGANYVGTQGDIWDAQKDMFSATCGAVAAMTVGYLIRRAFVIMRARKLQALAA